MVEMNIHQSVTEGNGFDLLVWAGEKALDAIALQTIFLKIYRYASGKLCLCSHGQ
jgi:hypothetical protein